MATTSTTRYPTPCPPQIGFHGFRAQIDSGSNTYVRVARSSGEVPTFPFCDPGIATYKARNSFFFFFFQILRRMGKNKALAHHTSTYFHTRRVSIVPALLLKGRACDVTTAIISAFCARVVSPPFVAVRAHLLPQQKRLPLVADAFTVFLVLRKCLSSNSKCFVPVLGVRCVT